MITHPRTRNRGHTPRGFRAHRVVLPTAGQCFEIQLELRDGRWVISIPEIDAVTEATHRADVEAAARECIAVRSGIPLGYISVWVRD